MFMLSIQGPTGKRRETIQTTEVKDGARRGQDVKDTEAEEREQGDTSKGGEGWDRIGAGVEDTDRSRSGGTVGVVPASRRLVIVTVAVMVLGGPCTKL